MIQTLPLEHKKERILGLDLMRTTAILLVVFHHGFAILSFQFIPLPDGVDIFFVLSGFLIGGIIIKSLEKNKGFTLHDLKVFWFRRWFRTLPAYWFTLFLNVVLYFFINLQEKSVKETVKLIVIKDKLWQFIFFGQNLFGNLKTPFFSESWSLSVEEWFYLLLPIILLLSLKIGFLQYRAVFLSIIIIIVSPMVARYFLSDIHTQGTWLPTRMIVIMRLDGIGLGVLMAYIKRYKSTIWNKMAGFKIFILIGMIIFYGSFYLVHENYSYFNSITLTNLFFYTITSLGVMIALPALSKMTLSHTIFDKIVTSISLISYSMYLINLSLIIKIIQIFTPNDASELNKFLLYVCYWVITIGLSFFMYKYIEQPFMALRDKYFVE